MSFAYSLDQIKLQLQGRILELVRILAPDGSLQGNDWVALNPTRADRNAGSFRITVKGSKIGLWKEFASDEGGDIIALIAYIHYSGNQGEAIKWALDWLGLGDGSVTPVQLPDPKPAEESAEEKAIREQKLKSARAIWLSASTDIMNSPVYHYLLGRGIDLKDFARLPAAIRYSPDCYCGEVNSKLPAMVTAIIGPDGTQSAVHRTYLDITKNGVRKAKLKNSKMTLGSFAGGYIPIARGKSGKPYKEATADDILVVCEGIEDGLTIAYLQPEWRVAAAVSAGNMAGMAIPNVKTVYIAHDNDKGGQQAPSFKAVMKLVDKMKTAGREVYLMPAPQGFKDWNDFLQAEKGKKNG